MIPTWDDLQIVVRAATGLSGEKQMLAMLEEERRGERRYLFILRMYGRYTRLRRVRELRYYLAKKDLLRAKRS